MLIYSNLHQGRTIEMSEQFLLFSFLFKLMQVPHLENKRKKIKNERFSWKSVLRTNISYYVNLVLKFIEP